MVMADISDRERGRRRRKRGGRKPEFEYSVKPSPTTRTPIILAKPPSERNLYQENNINHYDDTTRSPDRTPSKPIQVLRSRDSQREESTGDSPREALPSNAQSIPNLLAGDGVPPQVYTLQRNPTASTPNAPHARTEGASSRRLAPPPEMTQSVRLVDESFNWCETAMDMMLDQTDFFVVGVLGLQGAGKSTILSYLAGNAPSKNTRSYVFRAQGPDLREVCAHQTQGIDMYVTSERVILLDTQPLLSSSVLDHLIHHDKKYSAEYTSVENCVEMQSLQVASFLMTVCNVVVVAMDWFTDYNLLRLIQTSEMLKPPTPSSGHESSASEVHSEHYPHLVFLYNKAGREDFSVENYNAMQTSLARTMEQSKLKYKGNITMATGLLMPGLNPRTVSGDVNLFLLPMEEERKKQSEGVYELLEGYQGYPPLESVVREFQNQLFRLPRHLLTHTTLSEKNWFHYAARTWDGVKKSLLSEYNRLLP